MGHLLLLVVGIGHHLLVEGMGHLLLVEGMGHLLLVEDMEHYLVKARDTFTSIKSVISIVLVSAAASGIHGAQRNSKW